VLSGKGRAYALAAFEEPERLLHKASTNPPKFQLGANLVIVTGGELW
jgi:hypothetical protein